jgi:predicted ATPase
MGPVFGGHDPGVCANVVRGMTLCFSGQSAQAREFAAKGLSLAEALGHPHTLCFALMNALATHQTLGDREVVGRLGSRLAELAEKYNFPPMRAHALLVSAWARAFGTEIEPGLAIMEREYPRASAIGPLYRYYAAILADVRQQAGRTADALTLVNWALGTVTEPGVGMYVPELHRLHGVCLLDSGADDEGRRALQTALEVARQQGTSLFEFKAALSMAKAGLARGWPRDCLDPLRVACGELPAEFDAPWLAEAKQILAA